MNKVCFVAPLQSDAEAASKGLIAYSKASAMGVELFMPEFTSEFAELELEQFKLSLAGSQGLIADVSFERPSVYYELGVAEALGIKCALIAVIGTSIHQSIYGKSVAFYNSVSDYGVAVEASLRKILF